MKEYVIKLGANVSNIGHREKFVISPVANKGGITQIINAYGSNISIVKVDYTIKVASGYEAGRLPYPAVYANFGELEDSIPLKNGVAYTPEATFEKVQFNLNINIDDLNDPDTIKSQNSAFEVKAEIRILIGDGKYEQFATDAALNALEAIAQLQLKTAGGQYLGSHYQQSHQDRNSSFHQTDIQPEDIPEGTNYAILEFQQLEQDTSSGFIFTRDKDTGIKPTVILESLVSQNNGAKLLSRVELIKVNRILGTDNSVLSQEMEYNRAKVSFDVDASQHLTILQTTYYKYRWYTDTQVEANSHGFASWKIEFYKR